MTYCKTISRNFCLFNCPFLPIYSVGHDEAFLGDSSSTIFLGSFQAKAMYLGGVSNNKHTLEKLQTDLVWLPRAKSSFFELVNRTDVKASVLPTALIVRINILQGIVFEHLSQVTSYELLE
jgi:hypothetical protein